MPRDAPRRGHHRHSQVGPAGALVVVEEDLVVTGEQPDLGVGDPQAGPLLQHLAADLCHLVGHRVLVADVGHRVVVEVDPEPHPAEHEGEVVGELVGQLGGLHLQAHHLGDAVEDGVHQGGHVLVGGEELATLLIVGGAHARHRHRHEELLGGRWVDPHQGGDAGEELGGEVVGRGPLQLGELGRQLCQRMAREVAVEEHCQPAEHGVPGGSVEVTGGAYRGNGLGDLIAQRVVVAQHLGEVGEPGHPQIQFGALQTNAAVGAAGDGDVVAGQSLPERRQVGGGGGPRDRQAGGQVADPHRAGGPQQRPVDQGPPVSRVIEGLVGVQQGLADLAVAARVEDVEPVAAVDQTYRGCGAEHRVESRDGVHDAPGAQVELGRQAVRGRRQSGLQMTQDVGLAVHGILPPAPLSLLDAMNVTAPPAEVSASLMQGFSGVRKESGPAARVARQGRDGRECGSWNRAC